MTNAELLSKIKDEIEKRQEARQDRRDSASWENEYWPEGEFCTRDDEDDAILSIITSLQQDQPCLPFNLDEAAENYYEQDCPYPGEARVVNNEHDVWFPSQAIEDAFIAGAEWQKEQMMKNAVEADAVKKSIIIEGKEYSDWLGLGHSVWDKIVDLNWYGSPYKGEQIRIIIVKEDSHE